MKLVKCVQGHWFDADAYDTCPHCGQDFLAEKELAETTIPLTIYRDESGEYSWAESYRSPKEVIHLLPGTVLADRYMIGQAVGEGGFGIVYEAWDKKLEAIVAVKEFFPNRLATRSPETEKVIISKKLEKEFLYRKERFLAEARAMAKFGNHPNFIRVYEFFEANQTAYIVMELLQGISLSNYLSQNGGRVSVDLALMIANEAGNALEALHEKGVIHCDVAPDNLFLCAGKDVRVKLMDLGAARLAESERKAADIILKPGFSAVEQYEKDRPIGPWTDVYALGATLYVMLTGIRPEESTNRKIKDEVVDPMLRNPEIPLNLNNTVMKALAVEPHMRFSSVKEFLTALNGGRTVLSLQEEKKRKRVRRFSTIAAAVVVCAVLAAVVFGHYESKREEGFLEPAQIEVWFSVGENSSEEEAMKYIVDDFTSVFPDVTIDLKAISKEAYEEALAKAADNGQLPQLFESTDLSEEMLSQAETVEHILESEQAKDCLFLNQYESFYQDKKKIPLGIEAPVAYAVTAGAKSVSFKEASFSDLSQLGVPEGKIAADERTADLVTLNFDQSSYADKKTFFDEAEGSSPLLLSSTMFLHEIRNSLTGFEKACLYYDAPEVFCRFTYEWSLGGGSPQQKQAAERLLEWMLGNSYQSTLMITKCNEGQIPVNEICFHSKLESRYLAPMEKIYQHFVFEKP